ncbi:MAG TPA: tetratricopeptide repeat protein, partial [Burkholderiales bacterium]|nr:tetratricopeptide repeat protein [Burkholderiales bacterium]
MNPKHIAIAFLPVLFAACAQQPVKPSTVAKPVSKPAATKPASKPAEPKLPDIALSDDLLFEFLLGEIAGQRGDLGVATEAYVDMANKTRDPRIVKRALDIALYSGNVKDALNMAKLLTMIDPESEKARETLSALLAHSDNLEVARPNIEKLLSQQKGENLAKSLMQLDSLFIRQTDRKAVLSTVEDLTKPYLDHPEAHYAIAVSAWRAGERQLALVEAEKAESMRPEWETAVLLKAQILEQSDKEAVLSFLSDFLKKYPKSEEVRLAYAKLLVSERKFDEAHKEFSELKKLFPQNPDVAFAVGLLSLQLGNLDEAISDFKGLLRLGYKNPDLVRFYIAQGYELKKSWNEALKWYESVGEGPQYLSART